MLYELAIMTTRHGAEYALKTNRRDQLIEWIKGLLAVPFVLNSQSTAAYAEGDEVKFLASMAETLHCRYAEIMRDIEVLVNDHSMRPSVLSLIIQFPCLEQGWRDRNVESQS